MVVISARQKRSITTVRTSARIQERQLANALQLYKPKSKIGKLNDLPLELIQRILLKLNMVDIAKFCQVSTAAKHTVSTLFEYITITQKFSPTLWQMRFYHPLAAPDSRVAIKTNLLKEHSLAQIHAALVSKKCAKCKKDADLMVSLADCETHCIRCFCRNGTHHPYDETRTNYVVKRELMEKEKTAYKPTFRPNWESDKHTAPVVVLVGFGPLRVRGKDRLGFKKGTAGKDNYRWNKRGNPPTAFYRPRYDSLVIDGAWVWMKSV